MIGSISRVCVLRNAFWTTLPIQDRWAKFTYALPSDAASDLTLTLTSA